MASRSQQRRKNPQTALALFPVNPQLLLSSGVEIRNSTTLALLYNQTLMVTGPVTVMIDGLPVQSLTQVTAGNFLVLTLPGNLFTADTISLAPWQTSARGLNGEWLAPAVASYGITAPNLMLPYITEAGTGAANEVQFLASEDITYLSIPLWTTSVGETPVSASVLAPGNLISVFFTGPVGIGDRVYIAPGDMSVVSVSRGLGLAPATVTLQ